MFKRNLILALRVLFKNPLSTFITVGGLSLGIACFFVLFIYVFNEYNTDRFHSNYDDLYHVSMDYYVDDQKMFSIPPPAGMFYDLSNVPDIDVGTRVFSPNELIIEHGEFRFLEDGVVFIDSAWVDMFDFKYSNNNFSLFKDPSKVIISDKTATKIFGDESPIGKEIKIDGEWYIIENVLLNRTLNSSMDINFLTSFERRLKNGTDINSYEDGHTPYFVLSDRLNEDEIKAGLQELISVNVTPGFDVRINVTSFQEAYFAGISGLKFKNGNLRGNQKFYQIFIAVGILILVMAVINYINIVTARASSRAKEVGIKKTIGAVKYKLWLQFLTESLFITIVAGIVAIGLAELAIPYLNMLLVRPVTSDFITGIPFISTYTISLALLSFIAGIYPAFILSSFKPMGALKAEKINGKSWLRSILVTIQFTITSLLIFGVLVIFQQVSFLSDIDLGFDKDQIISIKASEEIKSHIEVVKSDLKNLPGVEEVSKGYLPGIGMMYSGNINGSNMNVAVQHVDEDFINMTGVTLLEGRFLRPEDKDTDNVVINKTFRDMLFGDGTTVFGMQADTERVIIGVIDDFRFSSVKNEVMPLELKNGGGPFRDVLIRLDKNANPFEIVNSLKSIMLKYDPDTVFEYSFLDADYDNQFKAEQLFLTLIRVLAVMSIFIGALGLFGLAQFNFLRNVKHIGVKKVLGAPMLLLVNGMIKSVISPILFGLMLALPLGYYVMSEWLNVYANRITLSTWLFVVTVLLVLMITLVTVLYQLVQTVKLNPVNALKEE